MKIAVASDHGGFACKQKIIAYLEALQNPECEVKDFGTYSADSCDYPDFAFKAAEAVSNGSFDRGIFVCTTGIGMSIAANKVKGIRCALCTSEYQAEMTRRHNDTNILAIGANCVDDDLRNKIISIWLTTEFEGGRHLRRILKVSDYENSKEVANV